MSRRQDEIAKKAVRKSTMKCLKVKKLSRLNQLKDEYNEKVREIELQYAEDPERLKAKFAAEDFARSEKAKKRAQKRIARAKEEVEYERTRRKPSLGEEISSAIVQGIGAGLFIAGTAILDTLAVERLNDFVNVTTVFYSLFGAFTIAMYMASLFKHALTNFTAKKVFNRLAHIFSFLIIGFAYSAYTITKIQGVIGWVLFGVVWGIILIGVLFYAIAGRKYDKLNTVLYCLAGFSGLIVCRRLFQVLSTTSFTMLGFAAGFYILGIIFYNLKKVRYMHFVGNIMMLIANIYMFFSLFFID